MGKRKIIQKVLEEKTVYEGKIFKIVKRKIEKETITQKSKDQADHLTTKRTYNRDIIDMDGAVAVAIMNNTMDKMLLVKQYRSSVSKDVWEILRGCLMLKAKIKELVV